MVLHDRIGRLEMLNALIQKIKNLHDRIGRLEMALHQS
ncbi:hypothetical protein AO384_0851 [Moraxella catarrhalis]|uniref:Uncharacterized protein n=1 Tax=Moraxella catarrhalis TaxID=480 RepID=A0A198UK33_MORCA|nr:hypothetical protein AO384_0851 [Moraxella catarrhalis]OAU98114.1 hypothetical protein AO383_0783 [Moraxella catarrhalis]